MNVFSSDVDSVSFITITLWSYLDLFTGIIVVGGGYTKVFVRFSVRLSTRDVSVGI